MNPFKDSGDIFNYHREMIVKHGKQSSYALGWRDTESQLLRFKALAGIANLNNHSVLDAGCGYADLLPYLLQLYPNLKHYCGIEQIPELYDEAIKRYGDRAKTNFISGNFTTRTLPTADYVMACGSLNYSNTQPDFIFKTIARLFNSGTIGLSFNLLSKMPVKGILVAYNPAEILNYCYTLSNNVVLIDDYSDEDFTIYLYH